MHSLNPVWDKQLSFPLREHDLLLPIQLTVIDQDRLSYNDYVGEASINITKLAEMAPKKDPKTGLYPNLVLTLPEFELPLIPTRYPTRVYTPTPTITFR